LLSALLVIVVIVAVVVAALVFNRNKNQTGLPSLPRATATGPVTVKIDHSTKKLSGAQAIADNRIVGPAHADGATLVDSKGHSLRLTGVNYLPLKNTNDKPFDAGSPQDYDNIASMGFNMVRLGITWGHLEPNPPTRASDGTIEHHYDPQYLQDMDTIVKGLTDRGVAVIISLQQFGWFQFMPTWLYRSQLSPDQARCDFFSNRSDSPVQFPPWDGTQSLWTTIAKRYAGNPQVIGVDIFNEPNYSPQCTTASLSDFYTKMGTAIRAVAPNWLLVMEEFGPGPADHGVFAFDKPPSFKNIVYSFHVYKPTWQYFKPAISAYVGHGKPWHIPMWMGEFNVFNANSISPGIPFKDQNWKGDAKKLFSYLRGNGVGWAYFAYSGLDTLFLQDGAPDIPLVKTLQTGFEHAQPPGKYTYYGIPNPYGTCKKTECNTPSGAGGGGGGFG